MKKKNNDKIEFDSLSEDQLQFFTSYTNKQPTITTDEPFDKSLKASSLRYAKAHKAFAITFVVCFISLIVSISLLFAFFVAFLFINSSNNNTDDFTIKIGDTKYTASYEDVFVDETMYIDMTKIAKIDNFIISGDDTSRKFTLPNHQYVRFENESTTAIVDGMYFEMDCKAIIVGNRCLIPIDFVKKIFK